MGFKNTFLKIGLNIQRDSDFRLHMITTWSILFIVLDIQMDPDFGDNRGLCHWNMITTNSSCKCILFISIFTACS